jgi:hypothetical protein
MKRVDRAAAQRAIAQACAENPRDRQWVEEKRREGRSFEFIAEFCAAACQHRALHLPPWGAAPIWTRDVIDNSFGGRPEEVALRRRLIAAGVSLYEPNVIEALLAAEAKAKPAA